MEDDNQPVNLTRALPASRFVLFMVIILCCVITSFYIGRVSTTLNVNSIRISNTNSNRRVKEVLRVATTKSDVSKLRRRAILHNTTTQDNHTDLKYILNHLSFRDDLLRVYKKGAKGHNMRFPTIVETRNDDYLVRNVVTQKTCAVIGNGGILLDSGCGREIDSHAFIIRSNLPAVRGYERDVGSSTHLTSMNRVVVNKTIKALIGEASGLTSTDLEYLRRLKHLNGSILWFPLDISEEGIIEKLRSIVKFWNRHGLRHSLAYSSVNMRKITQEIWDLNFPSAGMMVFSIAATLCEQISLYGFYPFYTDPGDGSRTLPYHYYGKDRIDFDKTKHEMPKEFKIFQQLNETTRNIRLVTGRC